MPNMAPHCDLQNVNAAQCSLNNSPMKYHTSNCTRSLTGSN